MNNHHNFTFPCPGSVGAGVELTRGCVVGSLCKLQCPQVIPENTVIYGNQLSRRVQTEKPAVSIKSHRENHNSMLLSWCINL